MTRRSSSFDLHVLGPPPAFVLSQDQTLRQNLSFILKESETLKSWCDAAEATSASLWSKGTPIPIDQAQVQGV